MVEQNRSEELQGRLEQFGDPRTMLDWPEREPDYLALLGITDADLPLLLELARLWVDREEWPEDEDDMSPYASIHAWRAAAQLGAVETASVLLDMMGPMDARSDDWHQQDFPHAFAMIGSACNPALIAYLADPVNGDFARACAAHSLQLIATVDPESRENVVDVLAGQLEQFELQSEPLNALLILYLIRLNATEAGDVIERAYAADRVAIGVVDNWNEVREKMGLEDHELVPADLAAGRSHVFGGPEAEQAEAGRPEGLSGAGDQMGTSEVVFPDAPTGRTTSSPFERRRRK